MKISSEDKSFVEKRERLSKRWPIAGCCCIALIIAVAVWLWFKSPNLINLWSVFKSIEADILPESTAILMAAILPIVVLALLGFVLVTIVLLFVAFSNERRLIRIIRKRA